ncbi:MAG: D-xylose ABC transporter substrate-binding protein, partial [Psychrobacillus psychrotolerans]
ADLAGVQRIVVGTQTMTVYKPIQILSNKVAEIAVSMAKGEIVTADQQINNGKKEVPSVLLPPIAVDLANLESTVIKDGFHTAEDIYGTVTK